MELGDNIRLTPRQSRVCAMGQILQFIRPDDASAFDDSATRAMGEAFDAACAVSLDE
jgi:hypothetical protein